MFQRDALVLASKNLFVSKESVNRCSHCKKFVYGLQNLCLRNVSSTDSANLLEKVVVLVQNFWEKKDHSQIGLNFGCYQKMIEMTYLKCVCFLHFR